MGMTNTTLKSTALVQEHKKLGAKLVDFAGYNMPVWYNNAKEEHLAVRNRVGMFDISHMGLVYFSGDKAAAFLQNVCTNDVSKTVPNKIVYTMILNQDGGILDDVMVGFNDVLNQYFMIINASNKEKIMGWFNQNGLDSVTVTECFDTHGLVAVQGPEAKALLQDELPIDWDQLGRFQSQVIELFGVKALVMRTGYTGEDGIEISISNDQLPQLWQQLVSVGITPCGLAARDSLRIESGLPLYGHELNESITPLKTRFELFGVKALVMRTGYTGEDGIEISISNDQLPQLWQQLVSVGITPCGLAARDSLRIESGLPLYGHELNESITPLKTRYRWVLKWGTGFIGEAALKNLQETEAMTTVGLVFDERCLPRQGYEINDGGYITSGSFSPVLNQPIAIAMVPKSIEVGQVVTVNIRNRDFTANVVELPFV